MRRRGFTLIELLVVVAIIALLMAILLPSLHNARGQAKRVVCAANLRQVAMGVYNYWTEWNGRVPYVVSPMTNTRFGNRTIPDEQCDPFQREGPFAWPESLPNVLMPQYLGEERKLFVCPAAVQGWPRSDNPKRYTYREAAVNQPNGMVTQPNTYLREHFGLFDGRVLRGFKLNLTGNPVQDAQQLVYKRAVYIRDMVRRGSDRLIGPHKGGIMVFDREGQVSFRSADEVAQDLSPNDYDESSSF